MPQTESDAPICPWCSKILDRVDHYGIEHFILDGDVYREANVSEGFASEIDLRCANCGGSLDPEGRKFFYEHWARLLEVQRQLRGD